MEFQAVVMAAGTGSRMRAISSAIPKCLLPVGNNPLILCSLNILEQAGFTEAIVLVRENEKILIQGAIEGKVGMKLDLVAIPKNESANWGTAESLMYIKDRLKKDVVVLGCDIVSDFSLRKMIAVHRSNRSSLSVLLVPFPKPLKEAEVPGSKTKYKFERDLIGLDPHGMIVFINSEADFVSKVPFKLNILEQNFQIKVHSNLMDGHVYIIQQNLLSFLEEMSTRNVSISTLKGEFLPEAVKRQFRRRNKAIDGHDVNLMAKNDSRDLDQLAFSLSSSSIAHKFAEDELSCYSYIDKDCLCLRVNTLVAYAEANKRISKNFKNVMGRELEPHSFQKSQVDGDSIVGDNCDLQTKSALKQTSIGSNGKLGERTKVTSSVVMENVTFGANCTIQGCIICPNVTIEDGCSLKNCIIAADQTIKASTKLSNEILQGSDHLMQI